ncbi:MAG: hypothetical protein IJ588_12915 [Prevotella sp.]|nr:hypothetical protein [Prevotella sp.]
MKKIAFGLMAIMACLLMTACGNNESEKVETMIVDIQENGRNWDADKLTSFFKELGKTQLECLKDVDDAEEYKKYIDLFDRAYSVIENLEKEYDGEVFDEALSNLMYDDEFQSWMEEIGRMDDRLMEKYASELYEMEEEPSLDDAIKGAMGEMMEDIVKEKAEDIASDAINYFFDE